MGRETARRSINAGTGMRTNTRWKNFPVPMANLRSSTHFPADVGRGTFGGSYPKHIGPELRGLAVAVLSTRVQRSTSSNLLRTLRVSYGSATLADAVRHWTGTGDHDVTGYLHIDKNTAHLATGTIVEQGDMLGITSMTWSR